MRTYRNIDTGRMPEKILATANYHSMVLTKIHSGRVKRNIARSGASIVDKYFGLWLDNRARREPEKYHHLYEWDKVGDKNARLFECEISNSEEPVINFYLKESSSQNENGYIFYNKASVMESGESVVIEPINSEILAFEIDGDTIFTPNEVTVESPGGDATTGAFSNALNEFMMEEAERSLESLGFTSALMNTMKVESDRTLSKMSGTSVINPGQASTSSAEIIARSVEVINNEL